MWHRVDLVWSDVSEERFASIFRVEKSAYEKPAWSGGCWLHVATSQKTALFTYFSGIFKHFNEHFSELNVH
jgi:hypothetical protein